MDLPDGRYILRYAFGLTLFRKADANHDDWTFFAYDHAPRNPQDHTAWFSETLGRKHYGRFLQWSPLEKPRSYEDRCFLFLRNDGTGQAYFDGQKFGIEWSHPEIEGDVIGLDPETASRLAQHVFNTSVNLKLEDPFLTDENRSEEIEFICGSQEELTTLTRWICYTEPKLFDDEYSIYITFNSSSAQDEEIGEMFAPGVWDFEDKLSQRVKTLLQLAYEYNCFTGGYREYRDYNDPYRFSGSPLQPKSIEVEVNAPSAHERAEALLELWTWLDGKVPNDERIVLLGRME